MSTCGGHGVAMPPRPAHYPDDKCWLCHLPYPPPFVPPAPKDCPAGFIPGMYQHGVMRSATGHISGIMWDQLSGPTAHLQRFKDQAVGPGHPLAEGMDPRCFIPCAASPPRLEVPRPLPRPEAQPPPRQCLASGAGSHSVAEVDGATLVTLALGELTASICPSRGCDLVSLTLGGLELLHRGTGGAPPGSPAQAALLAPPTQPGAWAGHGQTLFPAVGRHAGGLYAHPAAGPAQPTPMPLHGFALAAPFTVLALPQPGAPHPELTCQLLGPEDLTPEQRASYPFRFALRITHALVPGLGLRVTHTVRSREEEGGGGTGPTPLLPFALGNHVSFSLRGAPAPRLQGTPSLQYALAPGSLLSGAVTPRPDFAAPGGTPLTAPGVLDGVFGGPPGEGGRRQLSLVLQEGGCGGSGGGGGGAAVITVAQRWAPPPSSASCNWEALAEHLFFVLWGELPAQGGEGEGEGSAGFLCVEPWMGGPDALNGRCALLQPGEALEWEFSVEVN